MITAENVAAKIVERDLRDTQRLEAIHDALGHLIAMRKMFLKPNNRRPMHPRLLWAEWYYAKALHDLYRCEMTEDMFKCACDELGVDEEGNGNDD